MSKLQAKNQLEMNAPVQKVWEVITDITRLHKINPGVVRATGKMNELGSTRTCEMSMNGRKGVLIEKLIDLVPEKKTVWEHQSDDMGLGKMLKNIRYHFTLEKISESKSKLTAESYYEPATFFGSIMNVLMMKRMFSKGQDTILRNINSVVQDGAGAENCE